MGLSRPPQTRQPSHSVPQRLSTYRAGCASLKSRVTGGWGAGEGGPGAARNLYMLPSPHAPGFGKRLTSGEQVRAGAECGSETR
jgi:hypothetical protein